MLDKRKLGNLSVAIAMTLFMGVASASADVVVIGNKGLSASSLTAAQVKSLYTGDTKSLPDGTKAKIIDLEVGSASRDEFYQKVVKKTPKQMKAHWAKRIFTGKGSPPRALGDDASVKVWVARTPGGIGYVDEASVDDSVKVLLKP